MSELLTTAEAAQRLGVSSRRVLALIYDKRLPAEQWGRDWLIRESDLGKVARRPVGRPKKEKTMIVACSYRVKGDRTQITDWVEMTAEQYAEYRREIEANPEQRNEVAMTASAKHPNCKIKLRHYAEGSL